MARSGEWLYFGSSSGQAAIRARSGARISWMRCVRAFSLNYGSFLRATSPVQTGLADARVSDARA
eukprot:428141-Pyramimonas_sp.AAC.1